MRLYVTCGVCHRPICEMPSYLAHVRFVARCARCCAAAGERTYTRQELVAMAQRGAAELRREAWAVEHAQKVRAKRNAAVKAEALGTFPGGPA